MHHGTRGFPLIRWLSQRGIWHLLILHLFHTEIAVFSHFQTCMHISPVEALALLPQIDDVLLSRPMPLLCSGFHPLLPSWGDYKQSSLFSPESSDFPSLLTAFICIECFILFLINAFGLTSPRLFPYVFVFFYCKMPFPLSLFS